MVRLQSWLDQPTLTWYHIAGGLWQPEAAALAKIRREIDRRPERLKAVLAQQAFRNQFLDKVSNDEKKAVAKFVAHNQESALKTKPKVRPNHFQPLSHHLRQLPAPAWTRGHPMNDQAA